MAYKSMPGAADRAPRTYRSELRQRQAAETRMRIVAAAAELFAELGYVRTTLSKIAEAADLSIETVQAQGPKAALMVAAVEYAAVGVPGEESIFDVDIGRAFLAIDARDDAIDFLVTQQTAIHERSAPTVRALLGAAANDPELDRYLATLLDSVAGQYRRILEVCSARGWLRADVDPDELVATVVVLTSVDTYFRLVDREGWTVEAYRSWFRRVLAETTFSADPPDAED